MLKQNIKQIFWDFFKKDLKDYDIKDLDLHTKITYETALKYFINIQKQIEHLESHNLTLSLLDVEDFKLLDGNMFIVNDTMLQEYSNDTEIYNIISYKNFKDEILLPPEFKYEIPLKVNKRYCYYTIGKIIILKLEYDLEYISHTPLYWALKRSITEDSINRFLLII